MIFTPAGLQGTLLMLFYRMQNGQGLVFENVKSNILLWNFFSSNTEYEFFFYIPNLNLSGYVIIYYLYDIYWNVRTVICENYSVQTQKLTNYFQFLITGIIMLGKNINHYILRLKGLNVDEIGSFFFLFLKTQLYNHPIFLFVY